jgi:transcriptional regulator with XRE-family HTH domain
VTGGPPSQRFDISIYANIALMTSGAIIQKSRRMAGLSQAELARRLGTTPSVLSRWENNQVEPAFAAVIRAVEACELTLVEVLREPEVDPHDVSLLDTTLALTPDERLQRVIDYARFVRAGREALQGR